MTSNIYVDTFLTKKPHESIVIVQERLKDAMALDIEFADYFKERAQIEEVYAKSLIKASKKLYTMDKSILGHFAPVWESLIKEFSQVANIHAEMASRITEEIEKPLRQSPCPNEYQRLQQLEPVIQSIDSHNKNSLLSVKGSIFKKSSSSSGSKSGSWQQEGPEYLQLHQKLDEARLKRLKTSTEWFEQIQSDQLMKRVEVASMTMSTSEVFDFQYDIKDFCHERGKELSSGKLNHRPTRSNSEDNYQQQKANIMRPRAATMDSTDTHRSNAATKLKSVFKKKKKHDKHDDHQFQYTPESSFHQDEIRDEPEELEHHHTDNNHNNESTTVPTASPFMKSASTPMNHSPLVDNEGFSIPDSNRHRFPGTSDVSSQNTSDDIDSENQSFKQSQRIHVNIANQSVREDDKETNESFNRISTMLREKTPTINRKARGRRDTTSRSYTDSTLFNNAFMNPVNDQRSRSNSVLSSSSGGGDSNVSNPFLTNANQNAEMPSPISGGHSPIAHSPSLLSDPTWQLQSIQEVVNPSADIVIYEVISMDNNQELSVSGQIHLNYTGQQNHHHQSTTTSPVTVRIQSPSTQLGTIEDWQVQDQFTHVSPEDKDTYILDIAALEPKQGQYVPMISYKMKLTDKQAYLPIQLHPAWKCTSDASYLILKYNWNNSIVKTQDIKGSISVTDELATGVQSTPQGVWETEHKKLTWSIHDLNTDGPDRLLAKFSSSQQSEPKPIHLQYHYLASESLTGIRVESNSQFEIKSIQAKVQSMNIIIS